MRCGYHDGNGRWERGRGTKGKGREGESFIFGAGVEGRGILAGRPSGDIGRDSSDDGGVGKGRDAHATGSTGSRIDDSLECRAAAGTRAE
jgi:hypothetical protein